MPCGVCAAGDATLYPAGVLCPVHSPAGVAGRVVPTPDASLTLVALGARPKPRAAGQNYGPAAVTARPHTREGDGKAHLVGADGQLALCGRPAGGRLARWERCEVTPDVKHRCQGCDLAMRASNPKPWEPRYWWRA